MAYEELVDALRLCVKYGKAEDALANAEQAADAIEEISLIAESNERSAAQWAETAEKAVEQIPRWIPVTERLPEVKQEVLCACRAGIFEVLEYVNGINGPWYKDSRHVYMSGFVTHWMPLPTPPEE